MAPEQMRAAHRVVRFGWLVLGLLSLGLAALGVVLPLLPTTPLVILAAFAFARSSPRLHQWLSNNRVFGPIIADWQATGAIAPRYKAIALCMMGAVLVISIGFKVPMVVLLVQGVCLSGAALFILSRNSA